MVCGGRSSSHWAPDDGAGTSWILVSPARITLDRKAARCVNFVLDVWPHGGPAREARQN